MLLTTARLLVPASSPGVASSFVFVYGGSAALRRLIGELRAKLRLGNARIGSGRREEASGVRFEHGGVLYL
jgi:hypothetical protein